MSRPPRPFPRTPSSRDRAPSWQTLLEVQRGLAADELALVPRGAEGDFAETLFELSALVAHVLGVHRDHYVAESYLPTAAALDSLARHGKRLAYAPDPGLSATGFVAFDIGDGLAGVLEAGLTLLGSSPGAKVQPFELLEPRRVAAAWNRVEPEQAATTRQLVATSDQLTLTGLRLGLEPGDRVMLAQLDDDAAGVALQIASVVENLSRRETTLTFTTALGLGVLEPSAWRLFANPGERRHLFGWNGDPEIYPPDALQQTTAGFTGPGVPGTNPVYGWKLDSIAPAGLEHELFLDWIVERQLGGEPIMIVHDGDATAYRVALTSQREVSVSFHAAADVTYVSDPDVEVPDDETTWTVRAHRWLSGSATQIELRDAAGELVPRGDIDPRSTVLMGWRRQYALATTEPSVGAHEQGDALVLDGHYPGLEPGFLVILSDRNGTQAQVVELRTVETLTDSGPARTRVTWSARTTAPASGWTLGDLVVLGNVAAVGHGKRHTEILGSSDGVSPFLRFTLTTPRVSQIPGRDGAEPVLDVDVAGVRWTRVDQLSTSGPDDRHYRVEIDDEQHLSIVFGDGRNGAVPSAGRRHIFASYRVGLGRAGNLAGGQLSRMAKRHPFVVRVHNPLPLSGGSDPATTASLRRQANRWVRTIGRAVSVSDYADLALVYPGVVRASASFDAERGIVLAVAGEDGAPLADVAPLRAFLDVRRDTRLRLEIVEPERVAVHLALRVELEPGYSRAIVEQAVRRALVDDPDVDALFGFGARDIGARAHLSEVYAIANDCEGVRALEVTHFALTPPNPSIVHDQLRVSASQWLALDALDFDFAVFTTES